MIAGSCVMDALEPRTKLYDHGFAQYWQPVIDKSWVCGWNQPDSTPRLHTTTAVCVTEAPLVPSPPTGCECPPIEPLEDRFVRREQSGNMPPGQVTSVSTPCPEDTLLLGGSCLIPFNAAGHDFSTNLVSIGFAKDASGNDIWECAWNNGSPATLTPAVVAMCLRPPMSGTAPEAEPTSVRLVHAEKRETLSASSNYVQEVTCAGDDFLLWGSCTLADPAAGPRDLNIYRSGFIDSAANRPNTWQCGWNNPTTSTPTVIATALCLKPPSTTP